MVITGKEFKASLELYEKISIVKETFRTLLNTKRMKVVRDSMSEGNCKIARKDISVVFHTRYHPTWAFYQATFLDANKNKIFNIVMTNNPSMSDDSFEGRGQILLYINDEVQHDYSEIEKVFKLVDFDNLLETINSESKSMMSAENIERMLWTPAKSA
jgi:uncharacterized protein YlzI (FlbEa/FlbD family)